MFSLQVLQLGTSMGLVDDNSAAEYEYDSALGMSNVLDKHGQRHTDLREGLFGHGDVDLRRRAELMGLIDEVGPSAFEFLDKAEAETQSYNTLPATDVAEEDIALQREEKLATLSMYVTKIDIMSRTRAGGGGGDQGGPLSRGSFGALCMRSVEARSTQGFASTLRTAGALASTTRSSSEGQDG